MIPQLAETHRVIAPDLPGHGSSEVAEGALGADRVLAWLGELTCATLPAVVGHLLGGASPRGGARMTLVRIEPYRLVEYEQRGLPAARVVARAA